MNVTCVGLVKRFGARVVLKGAHIAVPPGRVAVLHGPSGIGKSTLLRIIAGLESPEAGTVHLDGRTVCAPGVYVPPRERGIGMVFQDFALWPHLRVEQHLAFVLGAQGVPPGKQTARIEAMLSLCGLLEKRRALPLALSGGEQQRVAIARAFVGAPRLLLLDEPFAHLDAALRETLFAEVLRRVREDGVTVITATHERGDFHGDEVSHHAFQALSGVST